MHSNLLIFIWRRKLSFLLLASGLVLLGLWTWAILIDTTKTTLTQSQPQQQQQQQLAPSSESSYQHVHIIQKLIAQANRVLRAERQKDNADRSPPSPAQQRLLGNVRFVRPTQAKKAPLPLAESFLFEQERLKILEQQQRQRNAGMEELNANAEDDRMLSSAERQTQYEHELQRMGVPTVSGIGPDGPRAPSERLVHLDLKGAPPKLSFLKQLLPVLRALGATGLLIEYEDMFPYSGALQPLAAHNAYKESELKDFLETAWVEHGLSIMPLVQTFGHLEYTLKLQEFEHLRELPESPQSICPSRPQSMALLEQMLTQVIELHMRPSANATPATPELPIKFTHLHIGCDEVQRMGECSLCRQRLRSEIFLTHVISLAHFVRRRWPQLNVVIWDDQLREMTLSELQNSQIGSYVEPMVWVYANDIYHFIQPQLWDTYAKVFPSAWTASAFKGAFGESLLVPPLQQHLENNIRWLAVIAKEGGRFAKGLRGLALTGWQRYDHFAVLCELLPVGMPSLMTSLSTVSKGYFSTNPRDNELLRVLRCVFQPDSRRSGHPWLELHPNAHHSQLFAVCSYPGHLVYKYAMRLYDKLSEVNVYLQQAREHSAWLSDYNVRHNFSSPLRVHELTVRTPQLIEELRGMARESQQLLWEVYDEHTVAEFVEQHIYPSISALHRQLASGQLLLQRRTWPQRPLPISLELRQDMGLITLEQQQQQQQQHPH
ncbi:hexosaminidase D [Drosophila sulfurigaster albostrigata]|uniref:hexosaminidase D n=1 Tax=Drosophila sulfurigaster albostrigata TaxID=89887 RepID=UPI002D21AF2E|nr:hexosaminidase D [Drosophila sulfurigaster albostrigata]XP_062124669.1 hexosaminidase D [Drosophila sulfurigaster albostrigata]